MYKYIKREREGEREREEREKERKKEKEREREKRVIYIYLKKTVYIFIVGFSTNPLESSRCGASHLWRPAKVGEGFRFGKIVK